MSSVASGQIYIKFIDYFTNKQLNNELYIASGQIDIQFDYYCIKNQLNNELYSFRPDLY